MADCPEVTINCEFCSQVLKKRDEVEHLYKCSDFKIACPNNCGEKQIKRSQVCDTTFKKSPKSSYKLIFYNSRLSTIWRPLVRSISSNARLQVCLQVFHFKRKHKSKTKFGLKESGCDFTALKTDMASHIRGSSGLHLNLVNGVLMLQMKQLQMLASIINEQNEKIARTTAKAELCEKFFGSTFIWKISGYAVSSAGL